MKQFIYEATTDSSIEPFISTVLSYCSNHSVCDILAHINLGSSDFSLITPLLTHLRKSFPKIIIAGCTTAGESFAPITQTLFATITLTVFSNTQIILKEFDCNRQTPKSAAEFIIQDIPKHHHLKAIEILATVKHGLNMQTFFDILDQCDPSIAIFGGGADDYFSIGKSFVFTDHFFYSHGILVLQYCGSDFHFELNYSLGWMPLGQLMTVTYSNNTYLYELNHEPAFNIYKKYLQIENDTFFYDNVKNFPLLYSDSGIEIARVPIAVDKSGTLKLAAEIPEGIAVRLSYADPQQMLTHIASHQKKILQFEPDGLIMFSCITRKDFIKSLYVETQYLAFTKVIPTISFHTYGEIVRIHGKIHMQNAALISVCMREGKKQGKAIELSSLDLTLNTKQASPLNRFVNFIQVATKELEEANNALRTMAITDSLTGLYNRREMERIILCDLAQRKQYSSQASLLMIDIDNFKYINDNFGHDTGDEVIKFIANTIQKETINKGICSRWGGEEFMIFLHMDIDSSYKIAEKIRISIMENNFTSLPKLTVSGGISPIIAGDSPTKLYKTVDIALYEAKTYGKNRIIKS